MASASRPDAGPQRQRGPAVNGCASPRAPGRTRRAVGDSRGGPSQPHSDRRARGCRPLNCDSGKLRGEGHIHGGRRDVCRVPVLRHTVDPREGCSDPPEQFSIPDTLHGVERDRRGARRPFDGGHPCPGRVPKAGRSADRQCPHGAEEGRIIERFHQHPQPIFQRRRQGASELWVSGDQQDRQVGAGRVDPADRLEFAHVRRSNVQDERPGP